MKKIPKTPQRAKRGSRSYLPRLSVHHALRDSTASVDDLRFNAQKRGSKVDDLRFNAPAARFKSTAFWPFPKPKTSEQWWWLAVLAVILVTYAYIVLFSIILAP